MDIRSKALDFEGVKVYLKQNKDGVVIHFAIHPDDAPKDLITAPIGSRYQVAVVRIDDDGTPATPVHKEKANRIIQAAGMLCRNPKFWKWLSDQVAMDINDEEEAVTHLHAILGIDSRAELRDNEEAAKQFVEISKDFRDYLSRRPL